MIAFSQRYTHLSHKKRELLRLMLKDEGRDISQLPIHHRNQGVTDLPLSYVQQSMWFLAQLSPDMPYYNLPTATRMTGRLNVRALEQTFNEIIKRHEVLRTTFPEIEGKPMQKIASDLTIEIPLIELQNLPETEQEEKVREMMEEENLRPFNLSDGPLIRVILYKLSEEEHLLLLTLHHIVWDGRSIGVLTHEMAVLYQAFSTGNPSPLIALPLQYADYALWQREWLAGDFLESQLAWWQKTLEGIPVLKFPTDRPRPAVQGFEGTMLPIEFPEPLTTALEELSQQEGTTLFMTLLAVFQLLLSRYSGQDTIVVGTPVANRQRKEVEGIIGYFANILVLSTDLSGNPTVSKLLSRVKEVTLGAYAHQDIPFEMLVEKLQIERDPGRNPIFQFMFALHHDSVHELKLPGLTIHQANLDSKITHFDMGLHLWNQDKHLRGYISYNKDLFDQSTMVRLLSHFHVLLTAIVTSSDQKIFSLPLLTQEEQQWLRERNSSQKRQVEVQCVHKMFEACAEQTPEAVAVVCSTGRATTGTRQLSYQELNERANGLAHYLLQMDTHQLRVGICLESSMERVVGVIGTLKASGFFVPLEPVSTKESLYFTLKDSRINIVLTQKKFKANFSGFNLKTLCLDQLLPDSRLINLKNSDKPVTDSNIFGDSALKGNPDSDITPKSLAYVFYTSGRGIQVEHRRVCQRLQQLQEQFASSGSDVILHQASPEQDSFIWEILWPLVSGGRLVIPVPDDQENSIDLPGIINEQSVSTIHFSPEALTSFLESSRDKSLTDLNSLNMILCSGGVLRQGIVNAFFQCLNCELTYLYNPPETAIEVGFHLCQTRGNQEAVSAEKTNRLPVYILDQNDQLVPVGVPGKICVGADGLTLTQEDENFLIPDLFSENENRQLIKTNDYGRWLTDGTLELLDILGRQVWKEGMRFDLGEVEAALLRHPSVEECHVFSKVVNNTQKPVAFIVAAKPFTPALLQEYLTTFLPEVMIPIAYLSVNYLPLTAGGQVNIQTPACLEVMDIDLVERWEAHLQSLPEVDQVKVVIKEKVPPQPLIHISDLLPNRQTDPVVEQLTTTVSMDSVFQTQIGKSPEIMAFSDGGSLRIPKDAPETLTEALIRTAAERKSQGIIFIQNDDSRVFQSYPELLETAKCILAGLKSKGLQPEDRVILQIENLQDHFTTFWACVLGGIVPVTVAIASVYDQKNSVVNKLWHTWELLEQPPILTGLHLVEALAGVPRLFQDSDITKKDFGILSVEQLKQNPPTENIYKCQPTDIVFFQLTSGSTGIPKCIQETHRGIIHHIHGSRQFNDYALEDITLNWLPMDHVVPILTCHLKDTYLGIQQIHVRTPLILTNPLKWLDLMETEQVTHTWSPNFGFKLVSDALSREHGRKWNLSSLKFFMNAGEQVTLPVIESFLNRMAPFGVPQQAMQPAFGMAEVCTCMTYQNDFSVKAGIHKVLKSTLNGVLEVVEEDDNVITFVDLGPPIPGVQIRIVTSENKLLPESMIGRFQIRGNVTTPGYFRNEQANHDAFVGDGWFNSGDLGFIKHGRLTLTGREKEVIIIRGANFYCYEIEDVVNNIEGVEPTFVAACAVDDLNTGTEGLAIFFVSKISEPKINVPLLQSIKEHVAKNLGVSPAWVIPLAKEEFPKTTGGKIQRNQLRKALASGQFTALLKQIDLHLETLNTLPDWFFHQVWQRKEAVVLPSQSSQFTSLVFQDRLGLGALFCEKSKQADHVWVEIGIEFTKLSPYHYRINPRESEHYHKLVASIMEDKIQIQQVVHLWTYEEYTNEISNIEALEQAQDLGVYSLLFLSQALDRIQGNNHTVRVLIISSHTQLLSPIDKMAYERTPIRGLVKTVSREMSRLDCRHIDLPLDKHETNVEWILRESMTISRDRVIAYREGYRWVPHLERSEFTDKQELPFKRGGIYLVSGGLGGIGVEIARYLLEHFQARLILIGRSQLFGTNVISESRTNFLATGATISERIAVFRELEQLGGEIIYEAADICNLEQMQKVVYQAKTRWQSELSGIIHLAGIFPMRMLSEETRESFAETLRPKLLGTWVLHQLIQKQGVFISFGSLFGFMGGVATGAYSTANNFLESFSHYRRHQGFLKTYCFSWSIWDEVGMSRGYSLKEQSRSQGYHIIPAQKGIQSFLVGLHSDHPQLLIGLDATKSTVQRFVKQALFQAQQLVAYISAPTGSSLDKAKLQMIEIQDCLGTSSHCDFVQIPEMPRMESGEIDLSRLLGMERQSTATERIAPKTGLERTIGAIWQEVLNLENVGIHQNFFELGGQSILLVQVYSKLWQVLQNLSIIELFRYPTISSLAKHLGQDQKQKSSYQNVLERAKKQKTTRKQRSRPKRRSRE